MTGGTVTLSAGFTLQTKKQVGTLTDLPIKVTDDNQMRLPFGVGAGTASLVVVTARSLAAGSSETLNLYDGSLLDVYGDAAPFRVLRGVSVWVESDGDSAGVTFGDAASNATPLFFGDPAHTQTVYPGGPAAVGGSPAGVTVTASTCNLKIVNNGAVPVSYGLLLLGSQHAAGVASGVLGLTYP